MTKEEIELKYQEFKNTPSDINEHLETLRGYADHCESVTEFGVRGCVSLFAFLASNAKRVVAVDILNVWVPDVPKLTFINADDLTIEIEETDFLFIDSYHTGSHLKKELDLHAGKVNKYIGFHDTGFFGITGEDGQPGLMVTINEFLSNHPEWRIIYSTDKNNGLTIMQRISN